MKCLLLLTVVLALETAERSSETLAKTPVLASACYPADAHSNSKIAELVKLTASTDADTASWRQVVSLPAVSASAIALVSDSTICAQALSAFNAAAQFDEGAAANLYLFSVGNVYLAENPHFLSGEFTQHFVFDSTFALKHVYLK